VLGAGWGGGREGRGRPGLGSWLLIRPLLNATESQKMAACQNSWISIEGRTVGEHDQYFPGRKNPGNPTITAS